MKRLLIILAAVIATVSASSCAALGRKDVHINLPDIHQNAMHKQYMKANKLNQLEIMQHLYRQANDAYYAAETVDQLYALREDVNALLNIYLAKMSKESMGDIQKQLNLLNTRINRSISAVEGDKGGEKGSSSYRVFGQELD